MSMLKRNIKQIEAELAANRKNLHWQSIFLKNYLSSPRGIFTLMLMGFSIGFVLVNKRKFLRTAYGLLTTPVLMNYVYKNVGLLAIRYLPKFLNTTKTLF